jgi:hypothetical protein
MSFMLCKGCKAWIEGSEDGHEGKILTLPTSPEHSNISSLNSSFKGKLREGIPVCLEAAYREQKILKSTDGAEGASLFLCGLSSSAETIELSVDDFKVDETWRTCMISVQLPEEGGSPIMLGFDDKRDLMSTARGLKLMQIQAEQARLFGNNSELWVRLKQAPDQIQSLEDFEDFHLFVKGI